MCFVYIVQLAQKERLGLVLTKYVDYKGQLISKWFFGLSISSKKRTNEFDFTTKRLVFVRFLEEIDDS